MAGKDVPVLYAEIAVLLKDATEPVLPAEMKNGFLQKGDGMRPVLDQSPAQALVQDVDAEVHSIMRSPTGLVRCDRPNGCILSCLDFASTQAISLICLRGHI